MNRRPQRCKTGRGGLSPAAAKPWLPLWLTAVALFASLGANVYLGWIAVDVRRRWRTLVEKAGLTAGPLLADLAIPYAASALPPSSYGSSSRSSHSSDCSSSS